MNQYDKLIDAAAAALNGLAVALERGDFALANARPEHSVTGGLPVGVTPEGELMTAGSTGVVPLRPADMVAAGVATPTPPPPAPPVDEDEEEEETPDAEGPELDSAGLPWDERIHSGAKSTLKDGTWKKLRGVDPELVKEVEAELRGTQETPETPSTAAETFGATPPPPPPAAPPVTEQTPAAPPVTEQTPAAPPVTEQLPGTVETFPQLIKAITGAGISEEAVTAAVKAAGLEALPLLASRPELVPTVAQALGV